MHRRHLVVALFMLVALGAGAGLLFKSRTGLAPESPGSSVIHAVVTHASDEMPLETATIAVPDRTWQDAASVEKSTPTATAGPLQQGEERGEDLDDVLLLYASTRKSNFDVNFRTVAEYYGLGCATLDLQSMELTDALLRDAQGEYFKLVGISADALLGTESVMTESEVGMLAAAIERGGVDLVVYGVRDDHDATNLVRLTGGAVIGATRVPYSCSEWIVSSEAPKVTRELTGQVIASWAAQNDAGLLVTGSEGVTVLVETRDDTGMAYPVLVRRALGKGFVSVTGSQEGETIEETPLRELYFDEDNFSKIIPLMFAMRSASGDEAWHNSNNYANLTVDDPALTEPYGEFSFAELLAEMETHGFHTTIAFIPRNYSKSEPFVVRLFRSHPERYSLVQHGNNADGYEFYKYAVSDDDEYEGRKLAARPPIAQEADIVEGMARMEHHRRSTGLPYDRVMVFPWGISPEPTLVLLKKYNFLATVNAQGVPLEAAPPMAWDHGMRPAIMEYGNFPMMTFRPPGSYSPFRPEVRRSILDLFIDKPALFYSGPGQLVAEGMDSFNSVADVMNGLEGGVEWRSLGYIIEHLYLEKENDDGSLDVAMYASHLFLTNEHEDVLAYHVWKPETGEVGISSLTVNDYEFPYRVEEGLLSFDVRIPPDTTAEIVIQYGT